MPYALSRPGFQRAAGPASNEMNQCPRCQGQVDPADRFCRACGAALLAPPTCGSFLRGRPSPEQAARYWQSFFRPFFITAFALFSLFFLASLVMVVLWFLMFH